MSRSAGLASAAATAVYLTAIVVLALLVDAATDGVATRNRAFVAASAAAGLVAGFAGDGLAVRDAPAARLTAAVAGPLIVALLLALTSTAESTAGRWGAVAATLGGVLGGAAARERLGRLSGGRGGQPTRR